MKLWKKNLFKLLLIKFVLFLAILFLIYIIIDLSIRSNQLSKQNYSLQENFLYYLCILSKRLDFLCCISFLIAVVTCYVEMHGNRELLALQTSGICNKEFSQPIYLFTALLSILFIINFEFLYPKSAILLEKYEIPFSSKKNKLLYLPLEKEQFLVYSESLNKCLVDVFYVKDTHTVFHIQTLDLCSPSQGHFVTQFKKNHTNQWERVASYPRHIFKEDLFSMIVNNIDRIPFEARSLHYLFHYSFIEPYILKLPIIRSHFWHKLVKSFLPILFIFIISNQFTNSLGKRYFFLYCFSLFICICMYALLGFLLILGVSRIYPTYIILGVPIIIALGISQIRYKY